MTPKHLRKAVLAAAVAASMNASAAPTDTPEPQLTDSAAYCRWVRGVAASESALMLAPTIFGTYGVTSGADAILDPTTSSTGSSATKPSQRVIAGTSYNFAAAYRGLSNLAKADADCKRYLAVSQLHAFAEAHKDAQSKGGLKAKLDVLNEALPQGDDIVRALRDSLRAGHATVEEVDAAQLRLDGLRQVAAEARQSLAVLEAAPDTPLTPVASLLAARDEGEARTEKLEARLREAEAWNLTVRGGYDRIFEVTGYTPLFVMATLSINLGWFFQFAPDGRAADGRKQWVRKQIEGIDDRVMLTLARLRSIRATAETRLKETATLLTDLEARYKAVSAVPGEKAKSYADYVWFDLVRVRADHRLLTVQVQELETILRGAPK